VKRRPNSSSDFLHDLYDLTMNNEYLGVKGSKRARAYETNTRNIQVILGSAKDKELAMKKVRGLSLPRGHKKKFSLDATQHRAKNSELASKTSKRSRNHYKTNCASTNSQGPPLYAANHKTTSRRKLNATKKSIERTTTAHNHN
jgi:hypothetical protein